MARVLTTDMKKCLQDIVRGKRSLAKAGTRSALVARELMNSAGTLTHDGWIQGVGMLPLEEQCSLLGVPHEKLPGLDFRGRPEFVAWGYFSSLGYTGGYCEGGAVLLLIRAAALDVLASINIFGSRRDAGTRFTEAQLAIHKEHSAQLLSAIRSANSAKVVRNFNEIYGLPMIEEYYPGLTSEAIASLFDALGSERLADIAAAIMEAPYTYRAGWPDLTMTNGSEMLWAEIKTTDRLHQSQITTLHRMKPLLPGRICVVQLIPHESLSA